MKLPMTWMLLCLVSAMPLAWAEPGYRWEMSMEMEGMSLPGMGRGNVQCLPARRAETPGLDSKECQLIEARSSGNNRFHWKARCHGAVSTGDFVYQGDTAYKGTITTEEGGEKYVMRMSGKRLDKCEYSTPKVVMPAMPDMTATCDQAVRDLEPSLVFASGAVCANRKKDFCARLNNLSPESYGRVADRVRMDAQMGSVKGHVKMEDALAGCGQRLAAMQEKQCRQAAASNDCDFLKRYCPGEGQTRCAAGRDFSGRDYSAAARSAGGKAGSDPLSQGLNTLKGLFSF